MLLLILILLFLSCTGNIARRIYILRIYIFPQNFLKTTTTFESLAFCKNMFNATLSFILQ